MSVTERVENEVRHSRQIALDGEKVWSWSSPSGQVRLKRRAGIFRHALVWREKVIEVGCGTGLFTQEVRHLPLSLLAIDVSDELLSIAREWVTPRGVMMGGDSVVFVNIDAHDTKLPSCSYDAIFGSSVLHHLDVPKALKEFHRLLRTQGTITFTEPNMLNPQVWIMFNVGVLKPVWSVSPNERAFYAWQLRRQLQEAGFRDIRITPFDFVHPSIPGWLLPYVKPFLDWLERVPLIRHIAASHIITAKK
jgi:ubiquinone/menaquinone biosynthesis C-methylase UbiE